MKKYVILSLVLVFSALTYAQTINYGIRTGINLSKLNFDEDPGIDNTSRNGFAFGGFVEYAFNEKNSIVTELQWSAEGSKDRSLRANYLNVPVQLRFLFRDFSLGIGPQASLKVWENNDLFSTIAVSGLLVAEVMITQELFIDARYSLGLTNVLDKDLTDLDAKNSTLQIGFGIKL